METGTPEETLLMTSQRLLEEVEMLWAILCEAFNRSSTKQDTLSEGRGLMPNVLDDIQANQQLAVIKLRDLQKFAKAQIITKIGC